MISSESSRFRRNLAVHGPRLAHALRRAAAATEDFVFPPLCGGCKRRGHWFCPHCTAYLIPAPASFCDPDQAPLPSETTAERSPILQRSAANAELPIQSAYLFRGPLRRAIHRYKYAGEFARCDSLAALMYGQLPWDLLIQPDRTLLGFVPLHKRKRRARGFDQAELLARSLAEDLGLDVLSGLVRVLDTPSQVGLGLTERRANVEGAFAWQGPRLNGERILLVDDVVTTGATMRAAASPLSEAGAARIIGISLARQSLEPAN